MGKVVTRLQQEDRFPSEFVAVIYPHLPTLNQTLFLQGPQVVGDQLLTFFKALCEFGLRRELPQIPALVQQIQDLSLQAVRVRRKRWNGKIFFAGVGIEFVGEWIKSDQAAVALSPNVFFSLKNTKVMRDLSVAHVKGAHEGPEVASRIGREVAHQSTALVSSVRGFMGFADEAEEPQAGSSGWQSQSLSLIHI